MHLWDVLLPINLGPLTYNCPEELASSAAPGKRVTVPLRKGTATGILIGRSETSYADRTKDIISILDDIPLFSQEMLKLLNWLSDYYLAPEGVLLKQAVPSEMLDRVKKKASRARPLAAPVSMPEIAPGDSAGIRELIDRKGYSTVLFKSPSSAYESAAAAAMLHHKSGGIVLFPEIISAERFYNSLPSSLSERACLLHGEMSAGRRSEAIEGIISSRYNIVIGTRTALFAPLRPDLIIVFHEHSGPYKLEEGARINVRDAAVMRGYFEKVPVLLMSSSPSLESWFNTKNGKYSLVSLEQAIPMPKTRIINMNLAGKTKPYLSKAVADEAGRRFSRNEKLLFLINRKGHSTTLNCSECGQILSCDSCNVPLVLFKGKKAMCCNYCNSSYEVPDVCSRCGSHAIEFLGAGTEKLEEDITELLGSAPFRFDREKADKRSSIRKMADEIYSEDVRSVIGTRMISAHIPKTQIFDMAAILNTDISLNVPDFRAKEKTYHELTAVRDLVRHNGLFMIQTRMPGETLFRHFRENAYEEFAAGELSVRKAFGFPPYSRVMNISISGVADITDRITSTVQAVSHSIELLGPTEKTTKNRTEYCYMMKCQDRKLLHDAARALISLVEKIKEAGIRIDIDPY